MQTDTGDRAAMTLVGSDGGTTGVTIPIPSGNYVTSDGAGNLLFTGAHGVYDAQPGGLDRITTGAVVAVGPTRWLTVECDHQRCENVAVDRASRVRHILSGRVHDMTTPAGVVSPDGSTAAVMERNPGEHATLHLLYLQAGSEHRLPVSIDEGAFNSQTMAWAPDGRRLFVAGRSGSCSSSTSTRNASNTSASGFRRLPR